MIVTVTPTIGDGTVVRWYHEGAPLDLLSAVEPIASASRNGVRIGVYLHEVSTDLMDVAQGVYLTLRRDRDADMSHLATHRHRGLFGPLEPVPQPTTNPTA